MTSQFQESRDQKRYKISLSVDAVIDDKIVQSNSRDVSSGGIFINTPMKLHAGKNACVVLSLPQEDGIKPFKLYGKSVRTEPDGVAIEFHGLSPYFKELFDLSISELLFLSS
tara:strand:+ start:153 stop:488 length:336 start_codon:yes stop_codon:yes gene_type:complete